MEQQLHEPSYEHFADDLRFHLRGDPHSQASDF